MPPRLASAMQGIPVEICLPPRKGSWQAVPRDHCGRFLPQVRKHSRRRHLMPMKLTGRYSQGCHSPPEGVDYQIHSPKELLATSKGSQQAAPSDVSHDGQEAKQADDEGNAIHCPELPHIGCDGLWQLQILAQDACTTTPDHDFLRRVKCGPPLLSHPYRAGKAHPG